VEKMTRKVLIEKVKDALKIQLGTVVVLDREENKAVITRFDMVIVAKFSVNQGEVSITKLHTFDADASAGVVLSDFKAL